MTNTALNGASQTEVKDRLLYLRSVGSGQNPYIDPPVPARGYVATELATRKELFTIPDAHAYLSANRRRFYSIQHIHNRKVEVIDALTGEKSHTIELDKGFSTSLDRRDIVIEDKPFVILTHGISANERWLFEVSRDWSTTRLLRLIDLENGKVLEPFELPSGCIPVHMEYSGNALFFWGNEGSKRMDLDTQQIASLNLPVTPGAGLSPDGQCLYYHRFDNEINVVDADTWQTIRKLTLRLKPSNVNSRRLNFSRDGSKLIVLSAIYQEYMHEGVKESKRTGTQFDIFDTVTGQHISAYRYDHNFHFVEATYNGTAMYTTFGRRNRHATTYIEIETETGHVRAQHALPNDIVVQLFLVP